ncbi:Matrix metalloproteinase-14 [Halotydeus destructor]|nr:Matrix metalloproteinase-14 [Halotydeus destructor]
MKLIFLVLFYLCVITVNANKWKRVKTKLDALRYLSSFGYMKQDNSSTSRMKDPILSFQKFMGLNATGTLDLKTMQTMNMPRCGMSDIRTAKKPIWRRFKRYNVQGSTWPKTDLTWRVIQFSRRPELKGKEAEIDELLDRAFNVWGDQTPLRFKRSSSGPIDIMIKFASDDHGDKHPFDGPGLSLAHAFYPEFGGDLHFDDTEDWSVPSLQQRFGLGEDDTDFLSIAIHEIGHSLGLFHSSDQTAVMYPMYRGVQHRLEPDDIQGITSLYGSSSSSKPRQVFKDIVLSAKQLRTESPMCSDFQPDAATCAPSGCFFFVGNQVAKINDKAELERGYPKKTDSVFPGAPEVVDAAVTNKDGFTYLFRENRAWVYNGSKAWFKGELISDLLPGLGLTDIDAATRWNDKTYFFKGGDYWLYDLDYQRPVAKNNRYPKPIEKGWKGLPTNLGAAFKWSLYDKTYVFKDDSYYGVSKDSRSVPLKQPPYPRESWKYWLKCSKAGSYDSLSPVRV